MSTSQSSDPFHNEIQTRKRRIDEILNASEQPSDIQAGLYNDEVKRLRQLRTTLPEMAIEREELPDAVNSAGEPVFETARHAPEPSTKTPPTSVPSFTQLKTPSGKKKPRKRFQSLVDENTDSTLTTPKQLSNANNANPKDDHLDTAKKPTPLETTVGQISQAIHQHRSTMPVDEEGKILRANNKPFNGSSMEKCIRYVLTGRQMGNAPKGYNAFWKAVCEHPDLKELFNQKFYQRGLGAFKFLPKLWKKS